MITAGTTREIKFEYVTDGEKHKYIIEGLRLALEQGLKGTAQAFSDLAKSSSEFITQLNKFSDLERVTMELDGAIYKAISEALANAIEPVGPLLTIEPKVLLDLPGQIQGEISGLMTSLAREKNLREKRDSELAAAESDRSQLLEKLSTSYKEQSEANNKNFQLLTENLRLVNRIAQLELELAMKQKPAKKQSRRKAA